MCGKSKSRSILFHIELIFSMLVSLAWHFLMPKNGAMHGHDMVLSTLT